MKRFASLLTIVAVSLGALASPPLSGQLNDHITWRFADSVLTISGTGAMPGYQPSKLTEIPWYHDDWAKDVTQIIIDEGITEVGAYCFGMRSRTLKPDEGEKFYTDQAEMTTPPMEKVRSIILPSTLKKVAHHAFMRVPVVSIHLPEGLERLDASCFANTNLRYVKLPSTLNSIGPETFSGCYFLEAIDFNDLPLELSAGLFFDCENLRMLMHTSNLKGIKANVFKATPLEVFSDEAWMKMFANDGLEPFMAANLPKRSDFKGDDETYQALTARVIQTFYNEEAKRESKAFGLDTKLLLPFDKEAGTMTIATVNHGTLLLPLDAMQAAQLSQNWKDIAARAVPTWTPANGRVALESVSFTLPDGDVLTASPL